LVNIILLTLIKFYERIILKGLVALDYEDSNSGNTPPSLITENKLNEIKIKNDGQSRLSNEITDNLNPSLNIADRENIQMKEKKIVNNKPSQFKPILGVNFHNVKR